MAPASHSFGRDETLAEGHWSRGKAVKVIRYHIICIKGLMEATDILVRKERWRRSAAWYALNGSVKIAWFAQRW